jgi:uncharacterized protein involved in exopolysaccharide biosynthesis
VPEAVDIRDYVDHVRGQWRTVAIACGVAALLAGGITLLLPKQYTATAKIVIEPPAGSDQRAATAVSPIYLESLRTYEHFAASDDLFRQAVDHFGLRKQAPERSLESWKSRVLNVRIPRNTKILEISATLTDPKQAHALAVYLAAETVKLNRTVAREGDREFTEDAARHLQSAKVLRDQAEEEWKRLISGEPVESLRGDIEALEERQYSTGRELLDAEALGAELASSGDPADGSRIDAVRGRTEYLRRQVNQIERQLASKRAVLTRRTALRDELEIRRKSAQAAYEAAVARARDTEASIGYRGERLKLIDPGIVPEKPSSPRIWLNLGAATLFALLASLVFVTLQFAYGSGRKIAAPVRLRRAGTAND